MVLIHMAIDMHFLICIAFKGQGDGKRNGRKIVSVRDANWQSEGYDAAGGGNAADGGFNRRRGYQKQHQVIKSF